jgi:hypothetical protein
LIGLSAVTHSNNMGQRCVRLTQVPSAGTVVVPAPASPNLAPPGFYMLFVADAAGVPSVSRMVRVLTRFGDFNQDNDVDPADRDSFQTCFTGPGTGPPARGCEPGDFDADADIDCDDWNRFAAAWTTGGEPSPLPACQSTGVGPRAPEAAVMLRPPWPNPSRDVIGFEYSLPSASAVQLAVHDVAGRTVAKLVDGQQPAGDHSHFWKAVDQEGRRLASGVYFARLVAAGRTRSRSFVLSE